MERTVTGLGYDLVDASMSAGGLLRVYIDHPFLQGVADGPQSAERFITVDDCERVTRQLQHVLEVEGCAYERLEVSSPGLDRPLKKAADYARFVGEQVELTLKLAFEGRKKFRGELQSNGEHWRLVLTDPAGVKARKGFPKAPPAAPGSAKGATGQPVAFAGLALEFSLDEVREAHLVPVVDFKGRRFAPRAADMAPGSTPPVPGVRPGNEVDGGRFQ